ncbi:MAG: tyrosine-protein phosphatase [Lachnospiraceae bacterium]|nr:tyrosine-protein phosphatase [Lachnospiraceae bacterium]
MEYLHRTHPSYVDTVMTRIDELYGNFDNYITQGLHISEEEKEQLRQMYLD